MFLNLFKEEKSRNLLNVMLRWEAWVVQVRFPK